MAHQRAVLVRAAISAGETAALDADLAVIRGDLEGNELLPFGRLPDTHFARFVILPGADERGDSIPPTLIYASSVDVSVEQHLRDLVGVAGEGLDRLFAHCEDYPAPADRSERTRIAYLRRHVIPTQAFYVNTVGRTVKQVRSEAQLRRCIEDFLDRQACTPNRRAQPPTAIRDAIRAYVAGDPELNWALKPAAGLSPISRLAERLRFAVLIGAGVLLSPLLVPLALLALLFFRVEEWLDTRRREVDHRLDSRTDLALLEDHVAQNQFSAAGFVKPGPHRALAATFTLWLVNNIARHVYTKGDLGTVRPLGLNGVDTIHFARWVSLDGGRRVMFMSNYDGSFESYMDDFINKVAWGLNGVFTHGVGYPPTRFLVFGGARDEQAFKAFLRQRQLPTAVWYSAYPELTAVNIANNAEIRAGLSKELRGAELQRWLRRF